MVCLAVIVGTILLAGIPYASFFPLIALSRFLIQLPKCFLRVCLPTFFAAFLKFFLRLTTSAILGAATCNRLIPTSSATGTIFLRKNGIAVFRSICACAPNPLPHYQPIPLWNGISTCFKATIVNFF